MMPKPSAAAMSDGVAPNMTRGCVDAMAGGPWPALVGGGCHGRGAMRSTW
jgi:hypothetical protein